MKLYNLYQNVILEEIIKMVELNEAVSSNDVDTILNGDPNKQGKFYYVSFDYKDSDGSVSNRWVQIFQRNISTANNGLIDAYQVSKNGANSAPTNERGSLTGWKKFRLDKMSNLKVSKVPFYNEPEPYTYVVYDKYGRPKTKTAKLNKTGNNSPTVRSRITYADIGTYQYAASTLKNKAYAEKKKQTQQQPVQQQPVQQPVQQKQVKPTKQQTQQKPVQQKPVQQQNKNLEDKEELTNV
jgi:hypothetical protein